MPKVSVIVNCFNGEKYLAEALDSIYAQTFTDWEIVFFDNNSADSSGEIASRYDSRIKYYLNAETIPLGAARRQAVGMACGEWIAFLDTDDAWVSNNLEIQLGLLEGTDYVLSYAGISEITESGELIKNSLPLHGSGNIFSSLLNQFDINMVTPLIRRAALMKYGLNFDPVITASEEYNLFMRLAAKGTVCAVNISLGFYRVSSNSLTNKQISKWAEERFYTLEQLERENPGIKSSNKDAFDEAFARGNYYKARYFMYIGDKKNARSELKKAAGYGMVYKILFLIAYSKTAWGWVHGDSIRRKISSVMSRIKMIGG